jgi:hypothetical protein
MALAYETSVPASYRTAFISKVIAISNRLGINPNWLMIVMRFETANLFTANVRNQGSSAVGLIQFTTIGAAAVGKTTAQLAAMSAVEQLDYVEKYLNQYKGKLTDLHQLYLAVFSPAYLGRPDAQKVYVSPSQQYTANKALDTNNDGVITVAEIKTVISRYVPTGYEDVKPTDPVMPFVIAGAVGLLLHKILS